MRDKSTVVVVEVGPKLNREELAIAFNVGPDNRLFRAIIQTLDHYREERIVSANSFMNENNALGMAGCNGAYDVLSTIIVDLDTKRKAANKV